MNITADEIERRIQESSRRDKEVRVEVPVSWQNGMCLPHPDGESVESAEFIILTYLDNVEIETVCMYEDSFSDPWGREHSVSAIDRDEYGRVLLRRCLLRWSLPIPVERADGWVTKESWEKIGLLPGPLLDAFSEKYRESFVIGDEEHQIMDKQAHQLFSKNSKGVASPCRAVSLYCTRSSFWDKFGMRDGELRGMSYQDFLRLKIMASKEIEVTRQNAPPKNSGKGRSRIAGPGGTRPSRAISVEG